jgi:hypothetical protein
MWNIPFHSRAIPEISVDHPDFVYHGSDDVDVHRTWRRFGWTPIVRETIEDDIEVHVDYRAMYLKVRDQLAALQQEISK